MNLADEFLKRELDCQRMAKFARDPQSRATWLRMAERWRLCAEKSVSNETLAASRQSLKRHSMSAAGGSRTDLSPRGALHGLPDPPPPTRVRANPTPSTEEKSGGVSPPQSDDSKYLSLR